jgi:hypothetical protein
MNTTLQKSPETKNCFHIIGPVNPEPIGHIVTDGHNYIATAYKTLCGKAFNNPHDAHRFIEREQGLVP